MKHPSFFLLFCMAVCLTACSDDKTSHSGLRELIISDMTFNCDQGSKTLVFRNEDLSTIECKTGTSWCTASIDAINSHLTVSVQANDTYDARTDTVTLADRTDGAMRTFIVTQARNTGLFIGETSFEASMYGDTITVDLESNVSYKVLIPDSCSWITMGEDATTRGLEKSSFNLYVAENKTYHERRAYITVVNRDENLSGTVTVIQPFNTVFEADSTSFSRDMDGGIVTINMKSNIPYEVQIPDSCSWVHLQKAATSRAVSSSSITLKVDENRTYHDRDALLSIYNREADTEIPVTIHQSFVTVFNVDSTKFDIDMEGGTFTVNIEANIPYDVTIPSGCDWVKTKDSSAARTNHKAQSSKLKAQSSKASKKSAITFKVDENTTYKARDAVITIHNDEIGVQTNIAVHQPFTTDFSVDKTDFDVSQDGESFTVNLTSNISYDISIPSDCAWITTNAAARSNHKAQSSKLKAQSSKTTAITFRAAANTTYKTRDAVITIHNDKAGAAVKISVHQPFTTDFSVDKTDFDVSQDGESFTVNLTSNIPYDITIPSDCAWITTNAAARSNHKAQSSKLKAQSSKTTAITFRAAANTTYKARDAVITIHNDKAGAAVKISVHQPFTTDFSVDKTDFDVSQDGESFTVNLTSNIPYDITIPSDCAWITTTAAARTNHKAQSSKATAITFRAAANTTYKPRDAIITIHNDEAGAAVKIAVHQPFTTVFNADQTAFDVEASGGTVTVNIESNVSYDVSIPDDCDWVTLPAAARTNHKAQSSKLKAQSSKSAVVFRVKENTGYSQRDAVVTIGNKDAGASVKIYISQKAFEASLSVEKTEYEVPMKGGDVTVSVESNVDFDVIIPSNCNWINNVSPSRSKTARTSIVTLRVSENKSGQDRNANVTISNADAGVSANISITQKFDEVFSIDTTTLETDELADTLGVTVAANVDVTVQSQAAWLKVGAKTDKSAGHWTQQIFVSPLTTKVAKRTGKVKFLNTATNKAEYVEVVQHRLLYISESEVSLSEKGQTVTPTLNNSEGMPVKWTSSNTDVATVSSAGKVTALANGSTVITVKSTDGKYSDKVNVTVEIVEDEEKEGDNPESRKRRLMKKRR